MADKNGIGYNRTDHAESGWTPVSGVADGRPSKGKKGKTGTAVNQSSGNGLGTDAVSQYHEPLRTMFNDVNQCPEDYLLWFHFVPWDHKMRSGRNLWEELCFRYDSGLEYSKTLEKQWQTLEGQVDAERFTLVSRRLAEGEAHAKKWHDACVDFFAKQSGRPVPASK
jgi:alpha-glucuronidase